MKVWGRKVSFIRKYTKKGRVYLAEVENKRENGKVRQRVIRYIGLAPEHDKAIFPKNISELSIDSTRLFGSVISLDFVARQIGLHEMLGEHWRVILALVYCHCHDYRSVAKVQRWFEITDLQKILGIPEITQKMLRDAITSLQKINHLGLQKSIFEKLKGFCGKDLSSVIYDVTNIYFEGEKCDLAKRGKDKENVRGRRLVQIGLAITKEHGFPIFHQVHQGNVHDAKIFSEAVVHFKEMKIHSGTIVYDRGVTAKSTIFQLSEEGWKVIAGLACHRGIKKVLTKMDFSGLVSYRNLIKQRDTIFYAAVLEHRLGDVGGKIVVVLNPAKKQAQIEERTKNILLAKEELETNLQLSDSSLAKYFTKTGGINSHAIKRDEKLDGISILFTNSRLSREELVHQYFEKDLIEKSFQSLKGVLSIRPVRMWLEENVKAHILICYLAYTLQTTFRYILYKNRAQSELDGLSVTDALADLERVQKIYFHRTTQEGEQKTQLSKVVTLTKKQEKILRAISPTLLL